ASALRGGAIGTPGAGAAAAAGTPGSATQVMTPGTQVLAATPRERSSRRRLPPWWPVAAAALAVLLLIAVVAAALGGDPSNTATQQSGDNPSQSGSVPQKEPSPADDRIRVAVADYVGQDKGDAKASLEDRGFTVDEEKVAARSEDDQKDTVATVRPHGLVEPRSTITLGIWEEFKPPNDEDDGDEKGIGNGRHKGKDED
ncbi:MAG: PASTA domain-containing protein, partial [Pseudonocardia sp.]